MKSFIFLSLILIVSAALFTGNAYRYTDGDTTDQITDEYIDANGNTITETEYRAAHEKQSLELQAEASKPFGQAGNEFGKSWGTAPLASSSPKTSEALKKKKSAQKKISSAAVQDLKPRVLVS